MSSSECLPGAVIIDSNVFRSEAIAKVLKPLFRVSRFQTWDRAKDQLAAAGPLILVHLTQIDQKAEAELVAAKDSFVVSYFGGYSASDADNYRLPIVNRPVRAGEHGFAVGLLTSAEAIALFDWVVGNARRPALLRRSGMVQALWKCRSLVKLASAGEATAWLSPFISAGGGLELSEMQQFADDLAREVKFIGSAPPTAVSSIMQFYRNARAVSDLAPVVSHRDVSALDAYLNELEN